MKNSFLIILASTIMMVVHPIFTSAQQKENIPKNNNTPEKQAEAQTKWLKKQLNLNEDLVKMVYQINLKALKQKDSTRKTNTALVDKRTDYLSITQNRRDQLHSVLSSEQYNKYLSIFENDRKKTP